MKPKHILVVSQYFYPESFRINDMCCEWVKRGYKVTVLTGIPNYPEGKFYKGYSWFKKRKEQYCGVDIIRIPLTPRGKGSIGMIFNYFSFLVSGFFWKVFTKVKADLVFTFEVSPMTQALIGVWYAKKHKIPNYLYVQDLWPENVEIVTGITAPIVIKPISRMVNYIYKNCDKIFATSPSFVNEIKKRVFDNKDKVLYWPQYAEEFYRPMAKETVAEIPNDNRFKVAFTGNIGFAQGLDVIIKTAKYFYEQHIKDVCFVIIGDGRNKANLLHEISENSLQDYFIMIDQQPPQRIPILLSACDVAFVSFMNNPLFSNTIPAKLQSYLACGMPIIAAATGETERIISDSASGVCSPIGDGVALAENIIFLKNQASLYEYSLNARAYFLENFEKTKLLDEMDVYFNID